MEVTINKETHQVEETYLQKLLEQQGFGLGQGTAIAVNQVVIPRSEWTSYVVQSKDQILIIKATQGG